MSFSGQSAAWHPALMPNSVADISTKPAAATAPLSAVPTTADDTAETHVSAAIPPSSIADTDTDTAVADAVPPPPPKPFEPATFEPASFEPATFQPPTFEPVAFEPASHEDSTADAWFPQYDASPASPSAALPPQEEQSASRAITDEVSPSVPEPSVEASDADDRASGHQSKVSFARTVTNEISWDAEDEDPEWNLPRTDTDPFKFMPKSNRTNSFPVVPPIESHQHPEPTPYDEPQLGSSEAMDIIHEVDHEVERSDDDSTHTHPAISQSQSPFEDPLDEDDGYDAPPSAYSTQPVEPVEDVAESRYEEGIPLISSSDGDAAPKKNELKLKDPFGDADADDDEQDDFFGSSAPKQAEPFLPPKFERKSTMQVLQGMNVGSLTRGDSDLLPTPEEEEDAGELMFNPPPADVEEERTVDSGMKEATDASSGDLAAQWAAALADDDDDELLLDDSILEPGTSHEVDPAAFFGDDDEGFLEDEPEEPFTAVAQPVQPPVTQRARSTSNRYLPESAQIAQAQQPAHPSNPYLPSATFSAVPSTTSTPYNPRSTATSQFPVSYGYDAPPAPQQQQQRPPAVKAQSFADKPKGGYHSPYDLPMDFVTPAPRKRPSMQQLPKTSQLTGPPQARPPLRSSSLQTPPTRVDSLPPTSAPVPSHPATQAAPAAAAPPASQPVQSPPRTTTVRSPAAAPSHESFFEDLPIVAKVRPSSRHGHAGGMNHYAPPDAPPMPPLQPATRQQYMPQSAHQAQPAAVPQMVQNTQYMPSATLPSQPTITQPPAPDSSKLIAPPRVNPYAPQQSSQQLTAPPPAPAGRYSPSPNQAAQPNGMAVAPPANRYSPAPPGPPTRTPSAGYAPASVPPPPILPHQPRTSSPLAHFEISYDKQRAASTGHAVTHGENQPSERRSSSSMYEPRLNRVPSLPPTQEVVEEEVPQQRPTSSGTSPLPSSSLTSQYSPQHLQQTPPPSTTTFSQSTLSPPKRVLNYTSHSDAPPPAPLAPPKRSQTQSPGALYGNRTVAHPVDPIPRPSSVQEGPAHYATAAASRPRGTSQNFNLVPPTDGTEIDPLERWKGAPVFAWGVGGAFASSFPQDVPRYVINQTMPLIHRAAGEVTVKNIREIQPLEERLAKFPGPLRGKSKKKDTLSWLTSGIEGLERSLPVRSFANEVTHEDKRLEERVLLWKILRLFVEYDGVLEGSPAVEKAVRDVLSPYTAEELSTMSSPSFTSGANLAGLRDAASSTQTHSDAMDSVVLEQIRKNLLMGESEKAAWDAVDKRLWGHALLISGAASPDLFKKVAQEFVRKEVNTPGLNNESLAALYEVLSGNHEECVDELVPVHARAGLQLMTTQPSSGQITDVLAGLDKWRETLCLVLSNRSPDDVQAINSLGHLLSGYGRAEAAHVCYLFSRNVTVFGGLDDPAANFVLLGADHRRQVDSFAKETDAVLLSEVYEYGLSLSGGGTNAASSSPHLAAYKLQHAMTLAEYGFRDKALQYCETILNAMSSQTRRSAYYHPLLETAVEDLMKRLRQAPKEESNSWIPKPSMNKVSDTVWNRFNKFVAGDENENGGSGADGDGGAESGPFARLAAGGTPTISRPPSAGGVTGMEMFGSSTNLQAQGFAAANGSATPAIPSLPATRAGSRYAPGASQPAPSGNVYEPGATYTPSTTVPGAIPIPHASARSAYDPTSSSYTPPSTLAALERSALDPGFRQPASVSPGLHPTHMPTAALSSSPGYSDSSRGGLSRKSSYVPLSQAQPSHAGSYAPPTVSTPPVNPYEGVNPYEAADEPQVNGSPYAPVRTSSPAAAEPVVEPPTPQDDKNESTPSFGYQPPSYGYEPPTMDASLDAAADEPETSAKPAETNASSGYAPPSFEPYSYQPPSFEAAAEEASPEEEPKPKKKSFMDDDEDDIPALKKPAEKSKAEKDRENAEMFRKIAEEDAKRAEAEKAAKGKKGWGIGSWFGGKKDPVEQQQQQQPGKAIRANLGEKSSFYFDPELKRWVNKAAGAEDQTAKAAPPPPPPRSNSQSAAPTPPPPSMAAGPPPMGSIGKTLHPRPSLGNLVSSPSAPNLAAAASAGGPPGGPPGMTRTSSQASLASGPPSRPATSMGNATSIDDLLGAPGAGGARKAGTKRGRKGRYVDVMAK